MNLLKRLFFMRGCRPRLRLTIQPGPTPGSLVFAAEQRLPDEDYLPTHLIVVPQPVPGVRALDVDRGDTLSRYAGLAQLPRRWDTERALRSVRAQYQLPAVTR